MFIMIGERIFLSERDQYIFLDLFELSERRKVLFFKINVSKLLETR